MKEKPGHKIVVLGGRGHPTPEAAVAAMRRSLEKDGIVVPNEDIEARRWTGKNVICPWEAIAQIPKGTGT